MLHLHALLVSLHFDTGEFSAIHSARNPCKRPDGHHDSLEDRPHHIIVYKGMLGMPYLEVMFIKACQQCDKCRGQPQGCAMPVTKGAWPWPCTLCCMPEQM